MKSQTAGVVRHQSIMNVRGGSSPLPSSPPSSELSSQADSNNDEPALDVAASSDTVSEESQIPPPSPETTESSEASIAETIAEAIPTVEAAVEAAVEAVEAAVPAISNEITPFQRRLPNLLTYSRCLSIPVLILTFYLPKMSVSSKLFTCLQRNSNILCSVLFAAASFTDWLDGYLARKWKVTSSFGAFLDPVADKLMVSTALILLSGLHGVKVAIPTAIILGREISVSALREWMAEKSLRHLVKVGFWGKVKTACTMVSLTMLLWDFNNVGLALLYACTTLTITSGWVYFVAAAPILMKT